MILSNLRSWIKTLEMIAEQGADVFYIRTIKKDLITDIQQAGIVRQVSSCSLFWPFSMSAKHNDLTTNKQSNWLCEYLLWSLTGYTVSCLDQLKVLIIRCVVFSFAQQIHLFHCFCSGGNLTLEDSASCKVTVTDAWNMSLGEYQMYFPLPPAGGALLTFILNIMKGSNRHRLLSCCSCTLWNHKITNWHFLEILMCWAELFNLITDLVMAWTVVEAVFRSDWSKNSNIPAQNTKYR